MTDREETAAQTGAGPKNNPTAGSASGQPASPCHASGLPPRVVEEPARPGCGIGGSPGRRKPSGWLPVHTKTGVTAARLPHERTEPGNRVLAPPARDDEADARKQQRRAAANCTSCPFHGQRSGAAPTKKGCPREEARR